MRITHVITRLIVGGAQENTAYSVLGLHARAGVDVKLLSGPSSGREGSLEHLFQSCPACLGIVPALVRPVRPFKDLIAWTQLTRIFRRDRPDIVHTHSGKAGVLGRLAAARAGVPVIIHTIHGPSFGRFQGPLANLVFTAAERYAARVTDHFVVVAEAMKQQYLQVGIGVPSQYTCIRSGFNLEPFLSARNDPGLRARYGLKPDDLVVGKIARLTALKGHDDLLAVAPALVRRHPRMKFLLVGDGELRERLKQRVAAEDLSEHFVFTGLVAPDSVAPLVGLMDVLVHLSLREGLARALPQALAAARPVVAYDCDGAREVCRDGETGFLVKPGDHADLEARLGLLAGDAALRARFGNAGRELVRDEFSIGRMVDGLEGLYARLSASPGGRKDHSA